MERSPVVPGAQMLGGSETEAWFSSSKAPESRGQRGEGGLGGFLVPGPRDG